MAHGLTPTERAFWLLRNTRFTTLATADADGNPWASTVNYVVLVDQRVRLIWYSMKDARHSANLTSRQKITGSIFRTDLSLRQSPIMLDGLQYSGIARAVPDQSVADIHATYYRLNFPDEQIRQTWMLPIEDFVGNGARRFYELTLDAWWMLDIDRWLIDKEDRRVELPSPEQLAQTLRAAIVDTP